MKVQCGKCGEVIVVADGLANGQHVRCPYCEGETEFRKPSRIELPTVSEERRSPAPSEARKPLRVIRKNAEQVANQALHEQQMASQRVRMAEEHVEFYERMKDLEHRRKTRERITGLLTLIVVVLCAVGIYWYVGYRKEQRHHAELAFAAEKNRMEAEWTEEERKQRALREKAEENQKRAEEKDLKRAAEERIRQEEMRKADEDQRRAREEEGRKRVEMEESRLRAQKLKEEALRKYREILEQVSFVRVDFWRNRSQDEHPQLSAGTRTREYIVPRGSWQVDVLRFVSSPTKEPVIERYDESGERTFISLEAFDVMTNRSAYLIVENGKAWIDGVKRDANGMPIVNESTSINPAREELGALYEFLRRHSQKMPDINYSVFFDDRKGMRKLVRRVNFGGSVSAYEAKRIIREELLEKGNVKRIGEKSQSRTYSNRPSGERPTVPDWKVDEILCSGRFCYSSDGDLHDEKDGQEEDGQKEDVATLKQKIAENLREIKRLRKENPACVLRPADGNIRNVIIRRATKQDRRYYECMEVKYVREHFYCTGCDIEHDDGHCRSSRTAYPNWRAVREKVGITLEIKEKIDALYGENEELSQRLMKAEGTGKRQ